MSGRYSKEVDDLREWFKERLAQMPRLILSRADYEAGVDKLMHPSHALLISHANVEWASNRRYELSYNQMCQAFFAAARDLEMLTVTDD